MSDTVVAASADNRFEQIMLLLKPRRLVDGLLLPALGIIAFLMVWQL